MTIFDEIVIAEIGSVHDGSFGNACRLIDLAADCGASAVKFQTHLADAEMVPDAPSPPYFDGEPRKAYFERTGFSPSQWRKLATHCADQGVIFLSSPFSLEAVDLLEDVGVSAYKIASGEVSNRPLLEKIAALGKPVLLSSGMSTWAEVDAAAAVLGTCPETIIMQCTSVYPCPPEKVGLNVLSDIRTRYPNAIPGYSDHCPGLAAAFAATALGARVIEKHLTFSRAMYGSDAPLATEPQEFKAMCRGLRDIWTMSASPVDKDALARELADMKRIFEKSVVAAEDIAAGTTVTRAQLAFKKPGDGIPAARYDELIGRRLVVQVSADHKFSWDDLK